MENKDLEQEIVKLEKSYWQAMKDNDLDTMLRLTADPCIVAGSQGVGTFTRGQMAEMMKSPNYTLDSYELDDSFKVQVIDADTVVVAYKVKEDLTVDGELVSFEAADASTWMKKNGEWVCVLHTESISGDPFGRDRMKH
jgi:hypothetical protein